LIEVVNKQTGFICCYSEGNTTGRGDEPSPTTATA